jgi:hypothetical protein
VARTDALSDHLLASHGRRGTHGATEPEMTTPRKQTEQERKQERKAIAWTIFGTLALVNLIIIIESSSETRVGIVIVEAFLFFIGLPVGLVLGIIFVGLIAQTAELAKFFWWDMPKGLLCGLAKLLVPPGDLKQKQPAKQPAPKQPEYFNAHGPDGSIIGVFDTILDAEICGLTAAGVKAVDLPLVLRERRRLGTFGSPARPRSRPARPANRTGRPYWR